MSLGAAEEDSREIHLPAEVDWHMLDKSRFFILGAALFSGVSATLYPAVVLKTRQQVSHSQLPCFKLAFSMLRREGLRSFYGGFGTSLMGTIPARALYMTALEVTKSKVGNAALDLGLSEAAAGTLASTTAGLTASMAAQLVWTPIDVVTQRLMVQGSNQMGVRYTNGLDAFRKIICADGVRGLYRGFGISVLTYAPSSAVWWGSYSVAHRLVWDGVSLCRFNGSDLRKNSVSSVGVQAVSAAMASGVSALITMPLDTVKTRLQVLEGEENGRRCAPTVLQTVRNLMKEGGLSACYRGMGPRWASMSLSAVTMVTTYEFLKKMSAKRQEINFG